MSLSVRSPTHECNSKDFSVQTEHFTYSTSFYVYKKLPADDPRRQDLYFPQKEEIVCRVDQSRNKIPYITGEINGNTGIPLDDFSLVRRFSVKDSHGQDFELGLVVNYETYHYWMAQVDGRNSLIPAGDRSFMLKNGSTKAISVLSADKAEGALSRVSFCFERSKNSLNAASHRKNVFF